MTNLLTNSKLAVKFAKGVCGLRKKLYDLQFVYEPDDNLWYIEMPWPGDRCNVWYIKRKTENGKRGNA